MKKNKELDDLKKELNKVKPRKTRAPRKKKEVIEPTPTKQEDNFIISDFFCLGISVENCSNVCLKDTYVVYHDLSRKI